MCSNVVAFPSIGGGQTLTDIPSPVFFSPGDEYTRVNIANESTIGLGLYPGAVVIFLKGFRQDGGIHLGSLKGEPMVARFKRHGRILLLIHEGKYLPAPDVEVYGAMAELYPVGLSGPRSVTYRYDRARLMGPLHPELGMELRLVASL